jgi:hypothetical protein
MSHTDRTRLMVRTRQLRSTPRHRAIDLLERWWPQAVRAAVAAVAFLLMADASTARAETVYRATLSTDGPQGFITLRLSTDEQRIVFEDGSGLLFGTWCFVGPGNTIFTTENLSPADPGLTLYLKTGISG